MGLLWSVEVCLTVRDYKGLQNYYFGIFHFLEFIIETRFRNRAHFRHTV